jgi:hypothetical protein
MSAQWRHKGKAPIMEIGPLSMPAVCVALNGVTRRFVKKAFAQFCQNIDIQDT